MHFHEKIFSRKNVRVKVRANIRTCAISARGGESLSYDQKTVPSRKDSNLRRLQQARRTSLLRYVTLVTAQLALELESVRTSRRIFFLPENGTYRPRPREVSGRNPELERPPILRVCADLSDTANLRGK